MTKQTKSRVIDMTKGNPISLLIRFAIPMLIGNLFQQLYNLADSVIVGKYVGTEAIGAVGSVGSLNFLTFSLCLGLGSGMGILISQYVGAGERDKIKRAIGNSVYITVAAGLLMSFLSVFFARDILTVMKVPAENFQFALDYMRIVCGATVVVAGYNTVSSILRALGDSKTPLIFLIVSCVVNIVLDLVLTVYLGMGVTGCAVATVISQFVALTGSIVVGYKKIDYMKLRKEHFALRPDIMRAGIRLGIPLALQSSLIAVSCVSLQAVVNGFGPVTMAAYTATGKVEQLVQQPFNSLGLALSTYAGQNYGAGLHERVKEGTRKSMGLVLIFSILMVLLMHVFGRDIVGVFIKADSYEVIETGASGLEITSFMYFFLGMIYVMRGTLNGVGDAGFSLVNGVAEVICRIGFALLLTNLPFVGVWGIWWTNGLTWTFTGVVCLWRFIWYLKKRGLFEIKKVRSGKHVVEKAGA